MRKPRRTIDLSMRRHRFFSTHHSTRWVRGTGNKDFQFPPHLADVVLSRKAAQKPIKKGTGKRFRTARAQAAHDMRTSKRISEALEMLYQVGKNHVFTLVTDHAKRLAAKAGEKVDDQLERDYRALINGASLIQHLMIQRQWDSVLESFFGNMDRVAEQGVQQLPAKYKPKLEDHQRQLGLLRQQVLDAFPKVVKGLAEKNPGVPMQDLMEHAVELIAQELRQLLQVLALYTTTIQQYLSGTWSKMLHAINAYMESLFHLCQALKLTSFKVGDVVLTGFLGGGLGTIPAGKGALQLHLLLVQIDMQDWTGPAIPLFGHEWEHQAFHDIPGLEDETPKVVAEAIEEMVKSGKVKLSSEKTKLGRNSVSTLALIVKLITDCMGEIDADIVGGVLLHGPAFLFTMMYSFPAMLIRGGAIQDAKKLLRTDSVYFLHDAGDGKMQLEFEPHPADWIRVYIVAAALEEIGFKSEADRLRKLADRIVGEVPEFLTFGDAEGSSSTVIKIAAKDIQALAETIAKTIIRKELASLGGKSHCSIICFTQDMQKKVNAIAKAMLAGETKLPTGIGKILPNFVGAAAAVAYWIASDEGKNVDLLPKLQESTFAMILEATAALSAAA